MLGDISTDHKVVIGNLLPDVTNDQVRQIFQPCGTLKSIRIARDKDTNLARGFAHLEFSTSEARDAALQFDKQVKIGTNIVTVQPPKTSAELNAKKSTLQTASAPGKKGKHKEGGDKRRHEERGENTSESKHSKKRK